MARASFARFVGIVGVLAAGLAVCAAPAAAKPRHKRVRRNHPFATDQAPARPAGESPVGNVLPGDGAVDGAADNTRGGTEIGGDGFASVAPDLSYSPWPYYGGAALLEMQPGRALLLTWQQGLLVLDTTDPDAPYVSARVAIAGWPSQLFSDGERAIVLSTRWDEGGASTIVTSVDLTGAPDVLGTATVDGYYVNAAASDGITQLLTGVQDVNPLLDVTGAAILPTQPTAVVTRLETGAGAPAVLGSVRAEGYVVASRLTADEAVLVTQRTQALGGADPSNGLWAWETVSELRVTRPDDNGAPAIAGRTELPANQWVRTLERTEDALLLVTIGNSSTLHTYDADAAPLASLPLGDSPAGVVLSGDVLTYISVAYGGVAADGDGGHFPYFRGPIDAPLVSLHTVDVADPAAPRAAAKVELGHGWGGPLVPARDGVLGTVAGSRPGIAFHADLGDPDAPVVTRTEFDDGVFLRTAFDEIGVFSVSRWTAAEGATQGLQIADLSAGLSELSPVVETSFPQQIDREGDLLGLAGTLRFSLLDISDPSAPKLRGSATLAVDVTDVEALGDDVAAVLTSDWENGTIEVRTVALPDGDALAPLDVLEVGRGYGRLFADPPFLYVVGTDWTGGTSVQVIDASDPTDLRARGSLDLASYPGEVFLKDGALLLLRRVWDLVEDPTAEESADSPNGSVEPPAGVARLKRRHRRRIVRKSDDFGRVRWPWLRDQLGAVLDSVDLADPDAPRAAKRTRLRWDPAGPARLAGDTLYVPSFRVITDRNAEHTRCVYGVGMIGVANPLAPRVGRPQAVPGMLAAATAKQGIVLTTSYSYHPRSYEFSVTLNLVDLTAPASERVLARADLGSGFAQVRAGDRHAYAVSSVYQVYPLAEGLGTDPFAPSLPSSTLTTFDLTDLAKTDVQSRDRGAFGLELEGGHLFLRSGTWTGQLDAYTLAAPSFPSFVRTLDVTGYAPRIRVADSLALIPAGLSGLQVFDLSRD